MAVDEELSVSESRASGRGEVKLVGQALDAFATALGIALNYGEEEEPGRGDGEDGYS